MADCASLLDEELSSFVFSYLTENSRSQYGEEEVSSDRLDADFPDIDLSQLDASDFDSVNCLSELHWCNDQSDASPASIQYSTGDPEFFEIEEEENAALLAALTDSLDGMVEDEVGGLSVFPSLGEGPDDEDDDDEEEEEEEEEVDLPLGSEPFPQSFSPETEDPSLLKKLLLSPPNVPAGSETHKAGSTHRHGTRSLNLKPVRPLVKSNRTQERKPRAVRPAGRLCTELHRHLTTTFEAEDTPSADTEDESDSEEEEEEEEDDDEEEEGEESGSEEEEESWEGPVEPSEPQFSSEKELRSVVELIKYMHTYCLPSRKQASAERRDRECQGLARRAPPTRPAPACPRPAPQPSGSAPPRPRPAFAARRREVRGHSLLQELLEAADSFDVSQPYRLHSPPYSRCGPDKKAEPAPRLGKPELKDSSGLMALRGDESPDGHAPAREPEAGETSFSVRRSRRLVSFPSRFAKSSRAGKDVVELVSRHRSMEAETPGTLPAEEAGHSRTACKSDAQKPAVPELPCGLNEKRACLCLPLAPKSTGDAQFAHKAFEQTLNVELCGTAGLTPPTTPPHKPLEDELFKPEGKGESPPKGFWGSRAPSRKLPEQTELYAQLRKMSQASEREQKGMGLRAFGDHDYCLQGLVESRKRPAPPSSEEDEEVQREVEGSWAGSRPSEEKLFSELPDYLSGLGSAAEDRGSTSPQSALSQALSPQNTEESAGCSPRPTSPDPHDPCTSCCPLPSSDNKVNFSCENLGTCFGDKLRSKANEDCRVFYIHNLPSGVTQSMLRRRFEAFGSPDDCKIINKDEERCGVITFRGSPSGQGQLCRRDSPSRNAGGSPRRFCRKRYIDLDEAGPGPVKSKYDALDFDTLLKEAQRSLHR
ncbi:hypothetical protein GJAV_G00199590 [Gymnothorax javanicus]|nr:hypothetical protein GJAV_G00199590 [Gymnothorax javanicus]